MERIVPALKGEVVFLRQELRHMLIIFWDQTFSLRELNDKVILQLPASSSDALNEVSNWYNLDAADVHFRLVAAVVVLTGQ